MATSGSRYFPPELKGICPGLTKHTCIEHKDPNLLRIPWTSCKAVCPPRTWRSLRAFLVKKQHLHLDQYKPLSENVFLLWFRFLSTSKDTTYPFLCLQTATTKLALSITHISRPTSPIYLPTVVVCRIVGPLSYSKSLPGVLFFTLSYLTP